MTSDTEPVVATQNGSRVRYAQARIMWENGDFSEWVNLNGGWPIFIGDEEVSAQDCEEALADGRWDESKEALEFSGWPQP